jgi:hypothetical protein
VSLSKGSRFKVLTRDHFTCRYCGRSAPGVVLHVDHVHPKSRGGSDSFDNLVTACRDCNSGKSARLLPEGRPAALTRETVPHVDRCGICRPSKLYAAVAEEPKKEGYVAYYQCEHGHAWRTFWSSEIRMTAEQVLYEVATDDLAVRMEARRAEAIHA